MARRRGIIQQSLRGRNGENRRGASGHGDQKPYKNTAPFFSGSGVLCKVDSPFSLLCLCMLLLREDIFEISLEIAIFGWMTLVNKTHTIVDAIMPKRRFSIALFIAIIPYLSFRDNYCISFSHTYVK